MSDLLCTRWVDLSADRGGWRRTRASSPDLPDQQPRVLSGIAAPFYSLVILIAESSLALRLLVVGVNEAKWQAPRNC